MPYQKIMYTLLIHTLPITDDERYPRLSLLF